MDDGAVRAGAGNRIEAQVAQQVAFAPAAFQPVGRSKFVDAAARRFPGQPGQKTGQRRAVPAMGVARAVQFDGVLARLGQLAGIGAPLDQRARRVEHLENPVGGRRGIGQHLAAGKTGQRRFEPIRRLDGDVAAQMLRQRRIDLAGRREQADRAVAAQDGEGQRKRCARHVSAADVEQPGDRVRQGEHGGLDAAPRELFGDRRALFRRGFAGQLRRMDVERGIGPRWPALPEPVDRVCRNRRQFRADRFAGVAQPGRALRRVQPRIVAQPPAAGQRFAQPGRMAAAR